MLNWSPEQLIAAILMLAQELHATHSWQARHASKLQVNNRFKIKIHSCSVHLHSRI